MPPKSVTAKRVEAEKEVTKAVAKAFKNGSSLGAKMMGVISKDKKDAKEKKDTKDKKDTKEKDERLLNNLDRVLKGNDSEIDKPLDEDERTAIEFARKMASLRGKPSEEFSADLKVQLVHRLAEQKKREHSSAQSFMLWGIEIPRRTMWQGTIAAGVVVIITIIILLITIFLNRPA